MLQIARFLPVYVVQFVWKQITQFVRAVFVQNSSFFAVQRCDPYNLYGNFVDSRFLPEYNKNQENDWRKLP